VVVADPNFAPMYATRTRKVKTDRRDARALAEACLLGAYRPAHRLTHSGTCGGAWRCAMPWSGRGPGTSP
jgi:transposase